MRSSSSFTWLRSSSFSSSESLLDDSVVAHAFSSAVFAASSAFSASISPSFFSTFAHAWL